MQHFVGGALRSFEPAAYFSILALLVSVYAGWRASAGGRIAVSDYVYRWVLLAACVAGSLGSLVIVGTTLQYFPVPGFIDHIEPQIAAVGWRSCLGDPPHPDLQTGSQTALPYGPLAYRMQCLAFRVWGASIAVSKATGIIAFALTLIIIFFLVFYHRPTLRQMSLAVLYAGWTAIAIPIIASDEYPKSYFWNRPEPFIVALAAAGACTYLLCGIRQCGRRSLGSSQGWPSD